MRRGLRFVRLLDDLRPNTDFDVSAADAEAIVEEFLTYCRASSRTENIPPRALQERR